MIQDLVGVFQKVRAQKPLVHHITNWVTIYECANITRAFGGLPVMAHAKEEAADMASIASALVLNIGTLTSSIVEAMILAGKAANKHGAPVILDLVGVGATAFRDEKAQEILNSIKVDILKGNASEVARLAGEQVRTEGVEATHVEADLISLARGLAHDKNTTVVITGVEDIVSDGSNVFVVRNGDAMLGSIVGTGCMVASVIGCCAAVEPNHAYASTAALVCFEIAGELAAAESSGPGSFKEHFYDEIYTLNPDVIERRARIEQK